MSIPREFIDLLLAKVDVVDLIHAYVPLRKKSGSNYFARCPFHNEKSASFSVSQPKQFFYCFGCGASGNAIDFLMQFERLSFVEAIESLAKQAGMEVPQTAGHPAKKDDSLAALFDLMILATDDYYEQMRHSQRAIQYLKNRGISGNIAKQFHLGYAPSAWSHLLDRLGKTDNDRKKLLDAGLIIKKEEGGYYDRFRDRIMFPIHDYRGRIIGFGGRIIDHGEPKYLNSPETPLFQKGHELYGLHQALKTNRKLDCVLIVEGYMDVIALFQHGISYAVATLGTATTAAHLQRLMRYTSDIIFCFDGDEAGRTAAWRALQVALPLLSDTLQIRFLFLPDGEDPDSLVRKEGQASFTQRIKAAPSLSDFFFHTLSKQSDMNTMEGRARFAATAMGHLKQLPTGLLQTMMLEELGKRARVDVTQLKSTLPVSELATHETPAPLASTTKLTPALRLALALLIQHPTLAKEVKEPLPSHLPGLAFLNQLVDVIQQQSSLTTGSLLEHWRGSKEEDFLGKLAKFDHLVPETGVKSAFFDSLRLLLSQDTEDEINQMLAKATSEGLTPEEKQHLAELITKKKQPVTS